MTSGPPARAPLDIEDHAALVAYLRAAGRIAADETPRCETLAGGVSNKTVLVERVSAAGGAAAGPGGEAWVLKQALPKLRVQVDWFSDPARIHREALGLRWLGQLLDGRWTVPFVFEDFEHHILAMAAAPRPHVTLKEVLLGERFEEPQFHRFGSILGQLHRAGHQRRDEVASVFDDRRFFESLRLEPYYEYAASQVPEAAGFLRGLTDEALATRLALVHGDYSPKNILVCYPADRIDGFILLDHEVIHWGDPAFDVGFALAHLLSKAHHLPNSRAALARGALAFWDAYRGALSRVPWKPQLEARAVRHTLGCLLARVAGRSTLEYLSEPERLRQRAAVVGVMHDEPRDLSELAARFLEGLTKHAHD